MRRRLTTLCVALVLMLCAPRVALCYLLPSPIFHSSLDLYPYGSGRVGALTVYQGYAYCVTDGEYCNYSADVSDPDNMFYVDRFGYDYGHSTKPIVWNDRLYIAQWFAYLDIFDITTQPGYFNSIGDWRPWTAAAFGMDVSNNRAYMLESNYPVRGFRILDVSNPANIRTVGTMTPDSTNVGGIAVRGSYAYICDGEALKIVNISNETSPYTMWNQGFGYLLADIEIRDQYAYITSSAQEGGFSVWDLSDQLNPVQVGHVDGANGDIDLLGNYAFCAGGSGLLACVNIMSPSGPYVAYKFNVDPDHTDAANAWESSVAGDGKFIYVGTDELYWGGPGDNYYKGKIYSYEVMSEDPDNVGPANWSDFSLNEAPFDTQYEGDDLPTWTTPRWTLFEGTESIATASNGILRINDTGASDVKWTRNWDATSARGTTILFRAKCDSYNYGSSAANLNNIFFEDGRYQEQFAVYSNKFRANRAQLEFPVSGNQWHTYRISTQGSQFKVYIDEAPSPVMTGNFTYTSKRARIMFGSGPQSGGVTTATQDISFDILQCYSNGVYGPSAATPDTTPDISVTTADVAGAGSLSGIDPFSASVYWSTDGGVTWNAGGWDAQYEGNALPASSSPVWTLVEGTEAYSSVNSGVLRINDNSIDGGSKSKWYRNWGMARTTGATLILRAKCDSVGAQSAWISNIFIEDGQKGERFYIKPDQLVALTSGQTYSLPDTGQYHIYRFTTKNGAYTVYLDENTTPIMSGALPVTTSNNRVTFGGGESPAMQDIYYDYVYYTIRGDLPPGGSTVPVTCTGSPGGYKGVITAYGLPFNQYSQTLNKIKFSLRDMNGVQAYSPIYNVRIIQDLGAPGNVTNLSAAVGPSSVILSWHNPADTDFTGTLIRYKTTGYPTGPDDGTLVVDKANSPDTNDSFVHSVSTNGVTYYYKAYAHDATPNYASGAAVKAGTPTLNVRVAGASTIAVDGNPADWNLSEFVTKSRGGQAETGEIALVGFDGATLYYGGYWTGATLPTNAADHTAKVYSRHNAEYQYFLVRCDDNDIRTSNPVSSNWANDCVEFYIDPGHDHGSSPMSSSTSDIQLVIDAAGQKNVYMTTSGYATQVLNGVTSAASSDASGYWIEVSIRKTELNPDMPAAGTFGVELCFRDNDSPDATYFYGNPSVSTMYGWSDTVSGGSFPAKIPDRWGHAAVPNLVPLAPIVTDEGVYTGSLNELACSWEAGDTGTTEYKYAIGTSPGAADVAGWTTVGSVSGVTRTGLALAENSAYYFSVQAGNGYGYWSSPAYSDGITTAAGAGIQEAKALADDAIRSIRGKIVTASFGDSFYIQEPGSYYGILALSTKPVAPGNLVDIAGAMKGTGTERFVDCGGNAVTVTAPGPGVPDPIALANSSLGGTALNPNTPGVLTGLGPNNIGSLVTIFGWVTATGTGFFYLDDGSAVTDPRMDPATGQPYVGVKVMAGAVSANTGEYWTVTGISTLQVDGSNLIRAVIARSASKL
ncbi:MAG: sugar-binding protein [Armatimonadota bacterium]|nr:sugar-binding protein [Armatimonadota bacterium]